SRLAWAKSSQDPRIAVGPYSPLEKKIKGLGGTHASRVRKLLVQELQQESETVDKLKTMSFDFRFAKADSYYYQRHQEMIREAWNYKPDSEWDNNPEGEKKPKCKKPENGKKQEYLVPEREMSQIEKHIHRAERARGLRDQKYRLIPQNIPNEMFSPKSLVPEDEKNKNIQKTHKTIPKKPKVEWAKEQMKQHRDRMVRGRALTEQRKDQKKTPMLTSHARPHLKPKGKKKEKKEFEKVIAYPIYQPSNESLIEVTVLMEKSKAENVQKPLQRELLSMPPFLKSQLKRNKKLKPSP
uniref:Similar to RIKEN cDNA 1700022C21 n=1 Tax=Rattus norvegicus TaxID=10116 RepID=A0A8I5Y7K1_RAT